MPDTEPGVAELNAPEADQPPPAKRPPRAKRQSKDWVAKNRARVQARLDELQMCQERLEAIDAMGDSSLLAGVERWYSASETARFFGRTNQWIYERINHKKFTDARGKVILPHREITGSRVDEETGKVEVTYGPMRFNLVIIREIALSMYRGGTVKYPELVLINRRITQAEVGEAVFDE